MDEILQEFLIESQDGLGHMENDLVLLEREPQNAEAIQRIFRVMHTIKGTCGFLGYDKLQTITHDAEGLLDRLRDKELFVTHEIADALLVTLDLCRKILANLEANGKEGDDDPRPLLSLLKQLTEGKSEPPTVGPQAATDPSKTVAQTQAGESHIRMPVTALDLLMNQVGELVLTRNRLQRFVSAMDNAEGASIAQALNVLTTQLQEGLLKTRMQPLSNVWSKLPRMVRDLATSMGKDVKLVLEGEDTELDRTLIEAVRDPLTHMIRNAIDHGIENPDDRVKVGKPREGTLVLRARHQAGQVIIEMADDGAGIDVERVKKKAVSLGVLTQEQASALDDREGAELIFTPGLTTAQELTDVSGRGVGMDIVKSNIKRINGAIEIDSRPGQGTTFKIRLPLTLAILPALVVTCNGQSFVIPQASMLELVLLEQDKSRTVIEMFHGTPVFRLRGNLRPIVHLRDELGFPPREANEARRFIAVLQTDEQQFGLVIDGIGDAQEIVVKPLSRQLRGLPIFAGATILGDGTVALILDVEGLAKQAHVLQEQTSRKLMPVHAPTALQPEAQKQLVVCRVGDEGRMAVPMGAVTRLEQFDSASIEWVGKQRVVQCRGELLPLVSVSQLLPERRRRARTGSMEGRMPEAGPPRTSVIVTLEGQRQVGVIVEEILDIVGTSAAPQSATPRRFVLGTYIVGGHATELIDLPAIVAEGMRLATEATT